MRKTAKGNILDNGREAPLQLPNPHVNPFEYTYGRGGMSGGVSIYFSEEMINDLTIREEDEAGNKAKNLKNMIKTEVFGQFVSMNSIKTDSYFSNIKNYSDIFDLKKSVSGSSRILLKTLSSTYKNGDKLNRDACTIRLNEEIGIQLLLILGRSPYSIIPNYAQQPILGDILALSLFAGISFPINISQPGVIGKLSKSSDYKDRGNVKLSPGTKKKLFPIFQAWKGNYFPENTADKRDHRLLYKLLSDSEGGSSVGQSVQRTKDRVSLLFQHSEKNPDTIFVKSGLIANHMAIAISTIFLEKKGIVKPRVNNNQFYYENIKIDDVIRFTHPETNFTHPETNFIQEYDVVKNSGNILCFCMENDESKILEFLENEALNNQESEKIFILDITKTPLIPLDDVFRYCKTLDIRVITTCSLTKFQRGGTKRFYGTINLYGFTQDEVELATKLIEKNDAGSTHDDLIRLPRIQKSELIQGQELVAKQKDALKVELVRMSSELGLTVTHSGNNMTISRGSDINLEIISGTYYLFGKILNTPANIPVEFYGRESRNKRDKFLENCRLKGIDSRDSFGLEDTQIQYFDHTNFRIAFGTKNFDMGQTQDIANLIMGIFE